MSVENHNGSFQTSQDIIDQNNTDAERVGFSVCVYQRISDELTSLVQDDEYMGCMGPDGRVKFTEIISLMQLSVDIGKQIINNILLEQQRDTNAEDRVPDYSMGVIIS